LNNTSAWISNCGMNKFTWIMRFLKSMWLFEMLSLLIFVIFWYAIHFLINHAVRISINTRSIGEGARHPFDFLHYELFPGGFFVNYLLLFFVRGWIHIIDMFLHKERSCVDYGRLDWPLSISAVFLSLIKSLISLISMVLGKFRVNVNI
jgi:hypothetical protein